MVYVVVFWVCYGSRRAAPIVFHEVLAAFGVGVELSRLDAFCWGFGLWFVVSLCLFSGYFIVSTAP